MRGNHDTVKQFESVCLISIALRGNLAAVKEKVCDPANNSFQNMSDFIDHYQKIINQGLVDNRYPLDHVCVQLPNGYFGIESILSGFQKVTDRFLYDEMLIPTVSTNIVFKQIPDEIKEGVDEKILTITHTGLHKLDDPYYLSGRPELVAPQIEKFNVRSYRDLPIRLALRYFRYMKPSFSREVSLITDIEFPALDAEGIFATEEEYKEESQKILQEFKKFVQDKLKISLFAAKKKYSVVYYTVLPNETVLEVARMNYFDRDLAQALTFKVLEANNKFAPPFIFDLNITSKLFAGVVAAHSVNDYVVLPMHCMRVFGTSFGVDNSIIQNLKNIRVDQSKFEFSQERFQKLLLEGNVFALKPADNGQVCIITRDGESVVAAEQLEAKLMEIMQKRENEIESQEQELFKTKFNKAVQYIAKDAAVPEGYAVLGTKEDDENTLVVGKLFLQSK